MQSLEMSLIVRYVFIVIGVNHVYIVGLFDVRVTNNELSRVLAGFLAASETNFLTVKVCGKRKREVGLVVTGCYRAMTNGKKVADILSTEIRR